MTVPFDQDERQAAARVEYEHPQWLVIWGVFSRRFWAFPRFAALPGTIIAAADVSELVTIMDQAETAAAHGPSPAGPAWPARAYQQRRRPPVPPPGLPPRQGDSGD